MDYTFNESIYFFSYGEAFYAYSFIKHVLIQINQTTYNQIFNGQDSSVIQEWENSWKRMGLIKKTEETSVINLCVNQIQFSFSPVHECNLRCRYCFADHGKNFHGKNRVITSEMVDKILDFVFFKQFSSCKNYRIDFVSGGEPLLNFDVIKYTIEKSKSLLKGTEKKLTVFLVTNGTIYNHDIIKYLDSNNVNIGISIDGDKKIHDENRIFSNNKGTYNVVVNTISAIKNSDDLSNRTKDIWALSVITGSTSKFVNIIEHHKKLGINHMQMELVRSASNNSSALNQSNVHLIVDEYRQLTEHFISEINHGSFEGLKMILNDNDYYGKILCRVIDGGRVYYRCAAGVGKINFDAHGNIYPCEFFAGNPDYCIGNIDDGIAPDKVQLFWSENVEQRSTCSTCWAKYICGGDCYWNSLLANKNIYEPDPLFCQVSKKIVEFALVTMFAMKENDLYNDCKNYIRIRKTLSSTGGGNHASSDDS